MDLTKRRNKNKVSKAEWLKMEADYANLMLTGKSNSPAAFKRLILSMARTHRKELFRNGAVGFADFIEKHCKKFIEGSRKPKGFDKMVEELRTLIHQPRGARIEITSTAHQWKSKVNSRNYFHKFKPGPHTLSIIERTIRHEAKRLGVTEPFSIIFGDPTGWENSYTSPIGIFRVSAFVLQAYWWAGRRRHNGELVIGSLSGDIDSDLRLMTMTVNNGRPYTNEYKVAPGRTTFFGPT